jgi:hypothetical protein
MPNFTGTTKEHCQALLLCLMLDMTYILPLLIN